MWSTFGAGRLDQPAFFLWCPERRLARKLGEISWIYFSHIWPSTNRMGPNELWSYRPACLIVIQPKKWFTIPISMRFCGERFFVRVAPKPHVLRWSKKLESKLFIQTFWNSKCLKNGKSGVPRPVFVSLSVQLGLLGPEEKPNSCFTDKKLPEFLS